MKISVIIPVYNRLEHLRAGILCLMKQDIMPDELIISDDGSSQNVLDFIGDLISKIPFKVVHVYHEDKGFRKTRALNNAVRISEGKLLIFCDQDLIFGEDYIKNIVQSYKKNNFIMGIAGNTEEAERNEIIKRLESKNYSESIKGLLLECKKEIQKRIKNGKIRIFLKKIGIKKRGLKLVGMSYALSKEDYIKVNGYDEKYQGWGYEDDDFGNRLTVAGLNGKILETKEPLLHLWHYFDPTKKRNSNGEYYYKMKKNIFKNKVFKCEYGYDSSIDNDKVKIKILNK